MRDREGHPDGRGWRAFGRQPNEARPQPPRRVGAEPFDLVVEGFQRGDDLLGVRAVADLEDDVEGGALGRHLEHRPVMLDLEHVAAHATEHGGDLAEDARAIGDDHADRDDLLLAGELAHHDRGQDARVDVATR